MHYGVRTESPWRLALHGIFQRLLFFSVLLAVWAGSWRGGAEEVLLPETVTILEEEAFAGCTGIREVTLPEGLEEIRARAFAGTALYLVNLPESVTFISEDAFEGTATPLLIRTLPRTEGVRYALANQLDFEAETVRRALLVCQCAYPASYALEGPEKDAATMKKALSDRFEVSIRRNLSKEQILSAVAETFAGAREEDISLFYYSGHGYSSADPGMNGALVGIDYATYLSAAELRSALDGIPGRKIVIIDACYSGGLIGRGELRARSYVSSGEDPAADFLRVFTARRLRGNLAAAPYYVMVSSTGEELSWEGEEGGVFTVAFAESKGQGDENGDGIVTFRESYSYAWNRVSSLAGEGGKEQTVLVYPEDCHRFGLFR